MTYANPELAKKVGVQLKRLRSAAGLSSEQMGKALGVSQTTASRLENGGIKLTVAYVNAWCDAASASAEVRHQLLTSTEEALFGPESWTEAGEDDSTNLQPRTAELEAAANMLSFYMPAGMPGLLQTSDYARRLLSSGPNGAPSDLGKRVADRMERQQVLYARDKAIRFVIPEAVLLWPVGPSDDPAVLLEHREQLARIETVMSRPNVRIGILPLRPVAVWRLGGFVIYDEMPDQDAFVHLETLTKPVDIHGTEDVEFYRRTFDNLMSASVFGDEARQIISSATKRL